MPFVLLRLNDWVGRWQRAAVAAIEQRLVAEYAPQSQCAHLSDRALATHRCRSFANDGAGCSQFLSRAGRPGAASLDLRATDRLVQRHCFTTGLWKTAQ